MSRTEQDLPGRHERATSLPHWTSTPLTNKGVSELKNHLSTLTRIRPSDKQHAAELRIQKSRTQPSALVTTTITITFETITAPAPKPPSCPSLSLLYSLVP